MVASREDLTNAEVEAWHRTHYRLDWLLYRTIGYAVLWSTLAIYVFWAEAGHGEHSAALLISISLTWILLQGMGMLWYDFHTRVSYEHWPEVRRRLFRHIAVSISSFAIALAFASAIHGISTLVDMANQPPAVVETPPASAPAPAIRWHKGSAPKSNATEGKAIVNKTQEKKPASGKTPAVTNVKPSSDKAAKPAANKPAPTVTTKAQAIVKKPIAKPVAKKLAPPRDGEKRQINGVWYRWYTGRWHMLRNQRQR